MTRFNYRRLRSGRTLLLLVLLATLALTASAQADDPPPPEPRLTAALAEAEHYRSEARRLATERDVARAQVRRQAKTIRRLNREVRRKWKPTVSYAYRLAAVAYGVSLFELRSIGWCESRHYPFARNGRYRGVMQEGPMFERGPYGRAGFSVWDPVANVMTAAHARVEDGSWRQWECKP